MGTHKAFLEFGSRTFIESIKDYTSKWFDEVFIVTNDKGLFKDAGIPVFEDIIPDRGPLSGIHTALSVTRKGRVFCVACDMPFSHDSLIKRLIENSRDDNFDCVVPRSSSGTEPLFAIYRTRIKGMIEDEITSGRLSIKKALEKYRTRFVDIKNNEGELVNINTPQEYSRYAGKVKGMVREER